MSRKKSCPMVARWVKTGIVTFLFSNFKNHSFFLKLSVKFQNDQNECLGFITIDDELDYIQASKLIGIRCLAKITRIDLKNVTAELKGIKGQFFSLFQNQIENKKNEEIEEGKSFS